MDVNYFAVSRWIKKCFLKAHWTIVLTFVCKSMQTWKNAAEQRVRDFTCAKSIENWETIKLKVRLLLLVAACCLRFSLNGDCLLPKSTSFRHKQRQNLIWIMFNFQFMSDRYLAWFWVFWCFRKTSMHRQTSNLIYIP